MLDQLNQHKESIWRCRDFSFDYSSLPVLMGILNVTPDSFSDGGLYYDYDKAVAHGRSMFDDGADIVDIGGESTRPFADEVSVEEELKRIIPVIEQLSKFGAVSVDTYKSAVARRAVEAGVSIINDVSGFTDPKMIDVAVEYNTGIVIMHMQGTPSSMQINPSYSNILDEISDFLLAQAKESMKRGLHRENIAIDPGIGFGKSTEENYLILNNSDHFSQCGFPLLIGASRKSFLRILGFNSPADRLEGSLAAAAISVYKGAAIVRVHDVKESLKMIHTAWAIKNNGLGKTS